jgi:hypothetical protein
MSEMIERVARAIWERRRGAAAIAGIDLEEWGDGGIPRANHIFEEARAAIEAMREPTDVMCDGAVGWHCRSSSDARNTWEEMIDEALSLSQAHSQVDK